MKVHEWIPSRNKRLSAMLHKPDEIEVNTPVVICCHGFTGDKVGANQLMLSLAKAMEAMGVVVRFDFAGSGDSEGEFAADTTVKGWQEDLCNVVDWVKAQPELKNLPLYLLGHSLGGLIVLTYSGKTIAGRIALAPVVRPVDNFRDIILGEKHWEQARNGLAVANFYGKAFSLEPGFVRGLLEGDYRPLDAAVCSTDPLLIIHGDCDVAVPLAGSEELYNWYAGTKELQIMTAADHVFGGRHAELGDRVTSWLSRQKP